MPKVTVLMAVYNGERYLHEAVESILNQSFVDFEFVIVEDGSKDNTWQILSEYAAQDSRIRLVRNPENMGLAKSLNKGLRVARGEYIARQDADDVSLPDRLVKQVSVLDAQPQVVLVSGNIDLIDTDGRVWHQPRRTASPRLIAWFLLFYNYLGGHSQVMFRREPVIQIGGYAETYPYSQDYELWLRLAGTGEIAILQDVLLRYRTHSDSITAKHSDAQKDCSLAISNRAISQLLGKKLDIEEIAGLRAFWVGPFPDKRFLSRLDRRLKQLFGAFLDEQVHRNVIIDSNLARELSWRIGRRYLAWAHVLQLRRQWRSMIVALRHALFWHLSGFVPRGKMKLNL